MKKALENISQLTNQTNRRPFQFLHPLTNHHPSFLAVDQPTNKSNSPYQIRRPGDVPFSIEIKSGVPGGKSRLIEVTEPKTKHHPPSLLLTFPMLLAAAQEISTETRKINMSRRSERKC